MSRLVIRDVVLPIVQRIMWASGPYRSIGHPIIQDHNLEEFLEEELRRYFGVIGANGCQHLREQLEEAKRNDPYAFEQLLRRLLTMYVKLSVKIRTAKKLQERRKKNADNLKKRKKSATAR